MENGFLQVFNVGIGTPGSGVLSMPCDKNHRNAGRPIVSLQKLTQYVSASGIHHHVADEWKRLEAGGFNRPGCF